MAPKDITDMLHKYLNIKVLCIHHYFVFLIKGLSFQLCIMLNSQTKGVKRKYLLCISVYVAYREFIHTCSSLWNPNRLTAVSHFPSSSPSPGLVSAAALGY